MFCCEACCIHCLCESIAVEVKIFFSLKQYVSGPCAFDEENGPERLESKGTNEKNLTFITWKKHKAS